MQDPILQEEVLIFFDLDPPDFEIILIGPHNLVFKIHHFGVENPEIPSIADEIEQQPDEDDSGIRLEIGVLSFSEFRSLLTKEHDQNAVFDALHVYSVHFQIRDPDFVERHSLDDVVAWRVLHHDLVFHLAALFGLGFGCIGGARRRMFIKWLNYLRVGIYLQSIRIT